MSRVTTMGELAASIAHEVNQPLAGIVNERERQPAVVGSRFA